jgi:hypothetical protein
LLTDIVGIGYTLKPESAGKTRYSKKNTYIKQNQLKHKQKISSNVIVGITNKN